MLTSDSAKAGIFRFVNYYEAVSYLDELVGRVLVTLKKQGLAENTIVVFIGDNGFMCGSRGLNGKVVPWEESVRGSADYICTNVCYGKRKN